MSEPASISSGIAERYATAIFEISKEDASLAKLEANIADLAAAIADSTDLQDLINSPVLSRADQKNAIGAIAGDAGQSKIRDFHFARGRQHPRAGD